MNYKTKIKDFFQYALVILVLLLPIFFYFSITHYIDPLRFKMIKLEEDIVRGDKKTIRQAITYLKKNDKQSYRTVLKYVDRIGEKYCIVADHVTHKEEYLQGLKLPGCYVRGSKTVYLLPNKDGSARSIEERAQTIRKMAEFSRQYWNEVPSND